MPLSSPPSSPSASGFTPTSSASRFTLGREEVRARIEQMTGFFLAHGVTDPAAAHRRAIIALGNTVEQQALVMGFSDSFAVVGLVLVIAGIFILLTGKPKGGGAAGGRHQDVPCAVLTGQDISTNLRCGPSMGRSNGPSTGDR